MKTPGLLWRQAKGWVSHTSQFPASVSWLYWGRISFKLSSDVFSCGMETTSSWWSLVSGGVLMPPDLLTAVRAAEREEQKTDGRLTVRKRLACHFQLNTGCSLGSSLQPCLVTPSFLPGLCGMHSAHHISLGFSFKLKRKFERNNFEGTFGIHTHSTTAVCLQLLNLNWISLQFVEQLRNPCGHTYLP